MLSACFASPIRHLPHLKTRSDAVNKDIVTKIGCLGHEAGRSRSRTIDQDVQWWRRHLNMQNIVGELRELFGKLTIGRDDAGRVLGRMHEVPRILKKILGLRYEDCRRSRRRSTSNW